MESTLQIKLFLNGRFCGAFEFISRIAGQCAGSSVRYWKLGRKTVSEGWEGNCYVVHVVENR